MTADLADALRATEEQALIYGVTCCNVRDIPTLRRYCALCERDHGKASGFVARAIIAKARRLLADAEQVAELERMAR
jgi:hypothetical protein